MDKMALVELGAVVIDSSAKPPPVLIACIARSNWDIYVIVARHLTGSILMAIHVSILMEPEVAITVILIVEFKIIHVKKHVKSLLASLRIYHQLGWLRFFIIKPERDGGDGVLQIKLVRLDHGVQKERKERN